MEKYGVEVCEVCAEPMNDTSKCPNCGHVRVHKPSTIEVEYDEPRKG